MILILFLAFLALAVMVSITDWRTGILLLVITGILQDPVRKLVAGTPVILTMSVIVVYLAILVAAQSHLQRALADFTRRFGGIWAAFGLVVFFLGLATINGLATNGLGLWRVPLIGLFTYIAPLPAALIGYLYTDREEAFVRFATFYSVVTSIALIGTVLEYMRFGWRALGMVAQAGDYIRYLPGIEVRMLSGFYRGPDIMAWHSATLACLAIGMIVRGGMRWSSWPWMIAASWGCFNALISGRRKAIYFIAVFSAVLVWRYFRRLRFHQFAAFAVAAIAIAFMVNQISSNEESSVYTRAALTTQQEVAERLEGGLSDTITQFGILGAGLGVATQGAYHAARDASSSVVFGWQEGGLGKLAVELGIPGLFAVLLLAWRTLITLNRVARYPDVPGTTQIVRVILFAFLIANIANFLASAQAYADPMLTLLTAFFAGCLFATSRLDEQQPAAVPAPAIPPALVVVSD